MQVRKYILKLVLLTSFLLTSNSILAAETGLLAPENGDAKSRIIASFYKENNQQKLIAGLEVNLAEGWKIYAPDEGGFGIPPSFNLDKSQNIDVKKFDVLFPESVEQKDQFGSDVIRYKVYKHQVIIPLDITVIDPAKDVNLEVEVSYGLCKDICIPAMQKFTLNIPAGETDNKSLADIQKYLPTKTLTQNESSEVIKQGDLEDLELVKISLIKALIIAFIGGVILNIMPCVLPVLSIKLLTVINHSNSKLSRIRFAFFSTTLGIIFSFLVFSVVAVVLKELGSSIGWGFQFQNPHFLIFLLLVLMIFIANLLGLFEFDFDGDLSSKLNNKINQSEKQKNIFIPNFFSGILAVLLATPCSAPFVGVAISFALSSDIIGIFLIFFSMALGLSLPYLILMIFPKAVKLLPRPGAWMVKIKQVMAGFLMATAVWLVYILIDNIGFLAAMSAGVFAVLILLFFKIVHKFHPYEQLKLGQKTKFIVASVVFIFLMSSVFIVPHCFMYLDKMMEKSQTENWIKFDSTQIPELVAQGKTVVIDITADWCITCKANKLLVLTSSEIKEKLKDPNIVAMRGDLTKPDEKIFAFMRKYNRYGIPFNMVFGPNSPDGVLTSELLSKEALLVAIDKASKK